MPPSNPEFTLLEVLDSFKATIDRSIGSLGRAVQGIKSGELPPEKISEGLRSVQNDLVDLSQALSVLTSHDDIEN